jgi:1-acyl-sn-glycerol-3-phosphate acyltransferase
VFAATDARAGTEGLVVLAELRAPDAAAEASIRTEIERLAVELTGLPADDVVLAPPGTILKTSSGKLRRAACRTAYERGELLRRRRPPWQQALGLALGAARARLRGAGRQVGGRLWSLWAWAVFAGLTPPFWLLIALAPTLRLRRAMARLGARLALAAGGILPRVSGLEHLPASGPAVVVANHASYLDGLVLAAALPARFAYVAKQELLAHPFAAIPLRRLGAAFVERFDAARGAEDSQALETRLAGGDALVFFAEGTFHQVPGLLPFRMGAFLAAARTGASVVPVTLAGTRTLLPEQQHWPRFTPLTVTIHPPLTQRGSDWQAALALRNAARLTILAQLGEPDLGS